MHPGRNQFVNPIQLVEIGLSKQKLVGENLWQLLNEKLCAASRQNGHFLTAPISTVYTLIQAGSSQKISVGLSLTQQRLTTYTLHFRKFRNWLSMADDNVFFFYVPLHLNGYSELFYCHIKLNEFLELLEQERRDQRY